MNFFVLKRPHDRETDAVTEFHPAQPIRTGEAERCRKCGRYLGLLPLLPPIKGTIELLGKKFGDFCFAPGEEILVTDRVVQAYRASDLTGLEEVSIVDITGVKSEAQEVGAVPRYHCCRVVHSGATIDGVKSRMVRQGNDQCEECRIGGILKRIDGVYLELSSWSGEDIFFARGLPGVVIVSQPFKDFCDNANFLNCLLIPAAEFRLDHYPWERDKNKNDISLRRA